MFPVLAFFVVFSILADTVRTNASANLTCPCLVSCPGLTWATNHTTRSAGHHKAVRPRLHLAVQSSSMSKSRNTKQLYTNQLCNFCLHSHLQSLLPSPSRAVCTNWEAGLPSILATPFQFCLCLCLLCLLHVSLQINLLRTKPNSRPSRGPAQAANSPKFTTPFPSYSTTKGHLKAPTTKRVKMVKRPVRWRWNKNIRKREIAV